MIRLLPDTILVRTALVLVAAIALALGTALFVFAGQRHEALASLGGRNAAERVAALVALVEATDPQFRRHTLRSMDTPGFRAWWSPDPVVADPEEGGLAAIVARHLRSSLDGRELRVSARPAPLPPPGGGSGRGRGMMHGGSPPMIDAIRIAEIGRAHV